MGCGIMFPRDYSLDGGGEHCVLKTKGCIAPHHVHPNCLSISSWVLSDDVDDWDLDVLPKPSEVQNDLYASNEDEEDEGEDMEGTKVTVSCCVKKCKNGNS